MSHVRRLLVSALAVVAIATPGAQQRPADTPPAQPTFRTGVDLVRVDVSVTGRNEEAVADLQASDFLVTEDDVPQKVETAQFIRLNGQPEENGRDLTVRDREHGLVEAAREDVRLFALFLDDYHIDSHPAVTLRLQRALESFVDRLQPTDLVVVMDPLTTLDGLTFTRDKWTVRERIRTFKGRRGELTPVRSVVEEAQMTQRNVWELRAGVTLSALEALVTHLGGLREDRKSVIFVSQGPPVGRPGSLIYPRLESALRAANRGNVTVHVLDPRPLGSAPFGGAEALARLSVDTGGRSIVNSNTPWDRIEQVFADASAYYLVGYSPVARADGRKVSPDRRAGRAILHACHVASRLLGAATGRSEPATEARSGSGVEQRPCRARTARQGTPDRSCGLAVRLHRTGALKCTSRGMLRHARRRPAHRCSRSNLWRARAVRRSARPSRLPRREGTPRLVGRFLLEPGPAWLKMTVRSADGSVLDRWTDRLVVPDYRDAGVKLGTPRIYRTRSVLEARRFDEGAEPIPTVSRHFSRTDRLVIDVPWADSSGEPDLSARLTNRDGTTHDNAAPRVDPGRPRPHRASAGEPGAGHLRRSHRRQRRQRTLDAAGRLHGVSIDR